MSHPFLIVAVLVLLIRLGLWLNKHRTTPTSRGVPAPGLVPRAELVEVGSELSDPVAQAALDAAKAGNWRPAAAHLSDGNGDWSTRYSRLNPFGDLAATDDTWLRQWREEQPDNPEAAQVQTDALVKRAWEIRTAKYASQVTREQAMGFHQVLQEAAEVSYEAVRLAPAGDPNAWVMQQPIAMGQGWSHERYRALWSEIVAREPHHYGAHAAALQYWCEKWLGSHELMHEFADKAIAGAPAGSLLTVLKLRAYWELVLRDKSAAPLYRSAEYTAALDAALADLEAADPAHPGIVPARGWIAHGLIENGRPAQALNLFRRMGREIAGPWLYYENPAAVFDAARAKAARAAA
ncbi:DUF4034 domain-containing protein [Kitasatospora purpeofusca]|uniref:DUF4034 domain-containing protein n=1 Tax=Kitasatospora purpeofusca TaxID=67352 RepID=A0ABZ1U952_9ACTN|nr:DUF4034 domain-containing protein [Kitasatospora purpeofusca]